MTSAVNAKWSRNPLSLSVISPLSVPGNLLLSDKVHVPIEACPYVWCKMQEQDDRRLQMWKYDKKYRVLVYSSLSCLLCSLNMCLSILLSSLISTLKSCFAF